jgi:hypothetical protein
MRCSFPPWAHHSVWVYRRAPAPSLSLNRIPFPSLWALTTAPASDSLPILWLSPCPWPWPTPFFLPHAHSLLFPEGARALYSILFCSHSRPRSSASFLLSLVGALQPSFLPSFLSVGHGHSPGHACFFYPFFLLPTASLLNLCVGLPAVVRACAAPMCNSSIHPFIHSLIRSYAPPGHNRYIIPLPPRLVSRIRIRSPKSPKSSPVTTPTPNHRALPAYCDCTTPLCLLFLVGVDNQRLLLLLLCLVPGYIELSLYPCPCPITCPRACSLFCSRSRTRSRSRNALHSSLWATLDALANYLYSSSSCRPQPQLRALARGNADPLFPLSSVFLTLCTQILRGCSVD